MKNEAKIKVEIGASPFGGGLRGRKIFTSKIVIKRIYNRNFKKQSKCQN